jgi:tRNA (cmo5U34)-methyltransferase
MPPGGLFVMADVIVPDVPVRRPTPLDPSVDKPERLDDLLEWLDHARLRPSVRWAEEDLVVVTASG